MGKRELIIVIAFIAVGALAYQLTAPPPKAGERSFSLRRIFSGIREEIQANSASATLEKSGAVTVRPGAAELRLNVSRAVPLTIVGEKRADIGYQMSVESTGPNEAKAREYADLVKILDDDLGEAQKLSLFFPPEGEQTAQLTLRVPNTLHIRLEGAGRVSVSDVAAVTLRNLAGEAAISSIAGQLNGSHRSGELTVTKVGGLDLTLSSSRARFTGIGGTIKLDGRNGTCTITGSSGAIEADMNNVDFTIREHSGPVRVSGETGALRVSQVSKDLAVDVRRMEVDVTLESALPATIITSSETLKLTLAGPPGVTIDAVTTDGAIRATDFSLEPTRQERESRLGGPIGGGGPRIVLRNSRGDIVIGLRK